MLNNIAKSIESMDSKEVKIFVQEALQLKITAKQILDEGLIVGMSRVGRKFRSGEIYIPEVLMAAENMKKGMIFINPLLSSSDISAVGTVVIGTVKGDLHNIGKNIVSMMLIGTGFEVYDIGIDKDETAFIDAMKKYSPDILGMSALLTTTMGEMEKVISALKNENLRDKVKIFVGGAPVTSEYAKEIGADYYAGDASTGAELAKSIMTNE